MRYSYLDFNTIERALSSSIEALDRMKNEQTSDIALKQLTYAKEEWKRALSYSMSRING